MKKLRTLLLLCLGLVLAACGQPEPIQAPPSPVVQIPQTAVGHYCGMYLFEHQGPKGQILLREREAPLWFTTIREVFAYTMLPEESKAIAATYVQDMAQRDQDGQFPEQAWIPAQDAWYLIYSRYTGGMGTIDALPFSLEQAAKDFQQQHGGQLVRFADMPENYIFGAVALP
ncbi:copper resistance protein CopZ [Alcaligenes faecalis]|uniref:nitrous oxide reductase accessory protein NosL n=1 Tax=Alcaligenes faecalis TaxID=511 RepID=UPI001293984E|nr:nitrous oxide reductase accessory protein NosL [Alcaligenes faecalis]QFY79336.1 copper resistance protein CopZ [Alcaligenes faecalis]HCB1211864.1 nitrous oxide reductase accessory protein NosL [Klebsiella pneumoniae]